MTMIRVEKRNCVAVVTLERSVTNPIGLPLVERLAGELAALWDDPEVRGVVLTSANDKFFSIGFNIPELFDLPQGAFERFFQAFNRACIDLYRLPKPTIAALKGHAVAGGCILALCCDYRLIAEGHKLMGLNEIRLGVPIPYPADCMLRALVGTCAAREVADSGEFYESETLLEMGMVDHILPSEAILPAAVDKARALGEMPPEAFALIKHYRTEPIVAQILAHLPESEQRFVERWYSEETRGRLREAMKRF
jgi:enoyl-CoA hydratase/carnithine racemase